MKQNRNFYAGQPRYEAPALNESFVACERTICGSNATTLDFENETYWEW